MAYPAFFWRNLVMSWVIDIFQDMVDISRKVVDIMENPLI